MKIITSSLASRPLLTVLVLGVGMLIIPCVVIPWWHHEAQEMVEFADLYTDMLQSGLLYQFENTARMMDPLSSSATNFARLINSFINQTNPSPSLVKDKVAPLMFQAFSTIPLVSQILYLGLDGSFFSYYHEGNRACAMHSSNSSQESTSYHWYKQPVDSITGIPYGIPEKSKSSIFVNSSWIQESLKSNQLYASFGRGLNAAQDPLILNTLSINGRRGVVSFGFSVAGLFNGSGLHGGGGLKTAQDPLILNTLSTKGGLGVVSFGFSVAGLFNGSGLHGGGLLVASQNGDVLAGEIPISDAQLVVRGNSASFKSKSGGEIGKVSCLPTDSIIGQAKGSVFDVKGVKETVYCSPLPILGLQSVILLSFPEDGLAISFHRSSRTALNLLIVFVAAIVLFFFALLLLTHSSARREMHFGSELIKQKEATQQAERKSMNKSLAYATASHDIRAGLACITALIDLCRKQVPQGSLVWDNLGKMDVYTKEFKEMLNQILDSSKIEAGKMQLEEEEFELSNLTENVVDFFYIVALKKAVDLILDPCDGSILKFSRVSGDQGRLRQILLNLLSNAVKFTDEGHVSIRAWARKPCLEKKLVDSKRNSLWKQFTSWMSYKKSKEWYNDLEAMNAREQNPNTMEFVFEVSDTGKGIPKENRESVFENFVQVKETALGLGGTGLGLGIVQSLVRLMGGEIGIVDKENGEKGTCFRFNIFLTTLDQIPDGRTCLMDDIETGADSISESLTMHTPSPRLPILGASPKTEGSHVVLLMQNEERTRATQKFMEGLGLKVSGVMQWVRLRSTLARIRKRQDGSSSSSSQKSELGSRSTNPSNRSKDVPLSSMDGQDEMPPPPYSYRSVLPGLVLLVLDASAGPFQELNRVVTEFKRGLQSTTICKVVWLDDPISCSVNHGISEEEIDNDPNEKVYMKPFHGSLLYEVIRSLPEFGSHLLQGISTKPDNGKTGQATNVPKDSSSSSSPSSPQKVPNSAMINLTAGDEQLEGVKILVAEDAPLQRFLAQAALDRLGASAEFCMNGQEAVEMVRMGLHSQRECNVLPYDYILMDCQMPIMNGFEATKQIRMEEERFGIHIPIIALTAHSISDVSEELTETGMDWWMEKPVNKDRLLEVIRAVDTKLMNQNCS